MLDHGAVGNGKVVALVSPTSAIEWLCMPRFDSPSVFARLLDEERGGSFTILAGEGEETRGRIEYVANTNVLRTRFGSDGDPSWEVVDFAPRILQGLDVHAPIEIVRIVRPLHGEPRLSVLFDPRPDYGRAAVTLHETSDALEVRSEASAPLHLYTNLPLPYVLQRRPFVLDRPIYFLLAQGRREISPSLEDVLADLDRTVAGWRAWSRTCNLPLFHPHEVLRSALCLKLHTCIDTGAIIAAATTSIPEAMGTERTWDYRYCWLRDAAFVVEALRRISQLDEGARFLRFLRNVAESGPLQPVYALDGGLRLDEVFLPHLAGFGGNGFVRIGNAAAIQKQNDLMGELVLCIDSMLGDPRIVVEDAMEYFPLVERLVEQAIEDAPKPDMGIWEFRTTLRHYTFSRSMCWAAIHRGASLAHRLGVEETARRWASIAEEERNLILERGFNAKEGLFSQSLDGRNADAANLLLPMLGLIDAQDPRFRSTLEAYERILVERGLMFRYKNPDDLGETTSAFSICTFWWAEALALTGRLDDAVVVFRRMLEHANPLGLFSEDVDPATGCLLGNFPQAYTHVGLIQAAMTIGDLLAVRDGKVRAWV